MLSDRGGFDKSTGCIYGYSCRSFDLCHNYLAEYGEMCYNSVEKLCKRLRKILRICCEKFYNLLWKIQFCVIKMWKSEVFHRTVEKFYMRFSPGVSPCKIVVLHSFHIPYYYDYYLLLNKEGR